ncbi:MAG: hypothetical protein Q7R33_01670 [Nitrosarchaeum sp.]|nr:hypothetical protein [Nitrosarchaeum sp.]
MKHSKIITTEFRKFAKIASLPTTIIFATFRTKQDTSYWIRDMKTKWYKIYNYKEFYIATNLSLYELKQQLYNLQQNITRFTEVKDD